MRQNTREERLPGGRVNFFLVFLAQSNCHLISVSKVGLVPWLGFPQEEKESYLR